MNDVNIIESVEEELTLEKALQIASEGKRFLISKSRDFFGPFISHRVGSQYVYRELENALLDPHTMRFVFNGMIQWSSKDFIGLLKNEHATTIMQILIRNCDGYQLYPLYELLRTEFLFLVLDSHGWKGVNALVKRITKRECIDALIEGIKGNVMMLFFDDHGYKIIIQVLKRLKFEDTSFIFDEYYKFVDSFEKLLYTLEHHTSSLCVVQLLKTIRCERYADLFSLLRDKRLYERVDTNAYLRIVINAAEILGIENSSYSNLGNMRRLTRDKSIYDQESPPHAPQYTFPAPVVDTFEVSGRVIESYGHNNNDDSVVRNEKSEDDDEEHEGEREEEEKDDVDSRTVMEVLNQLFQEDGIFLDRYYPFFLSKLPEDVLLMIIKTKNGARFVYESLSHIYTVFYIKKAQELGRVQEEEFFAKILPLIKKFVALPVHGDPVHVLPSPNVLDQPREACSQVIRTVLPHLPSFIGNEHTEMILCHLLFTCEKEDAAVIISRILGLYGDNIPHSLSSQYLLLELLIKILTKPVPVVPGHTIDLIPLISPILPHLLHFHKQGGVLKRLVLSFFDHSYYSIKIIVFDELLKSIDDLLVTKEGRRMVSDALLVHVDAKTESSEPKEVKIQYQKKLESFIRKLFQMSIGVVSRDYHVANFFLYELVEEFKRREVLSMQLFLRTCFQVFIDQKKDTNGLDLFIKLLYRDTTSTIISVISKKIYECMSDDSSCVRKYRDFLRSVVSHSSFDAGRVNYGQTFSESLRLFGIEVSGLREVITVDLPDEN